MSDGRLWLLRDTYATQNAWAPHHVGKSYGYPVSAPSTPPLAPFAPTPKPKPPARPATTTAPPATST